MLELIHNILYEYSYFVLFFVSFSYFTFLYFGIAPLFLFCCRFLEQRNVVHRIVTEKVASFQVRFEIKQSLLSIVIFGFSIIPVIFLIRIDVVTLLPNTVFNVIWGVVLLTLWNEVHFYLVHRLMHSKFFMKRVHYIHHRSKIPTVYSVYSFH